MKIQIDVEALFKDLPDKFQYIGKASNGCLFGFVNRPEINKAGNFHEYSSPGSPAWIFIKVEPEIFERPKPSLWKPIEECDVDDSIDVLLINRLKIIK
jgi:hypothetical protein